MDAKEVLTQAKAKIATMDTWCQGTLARRPDGEFFTDVDPHDPRACQWCLDGAVHAVLRGLAYTEKDEESVELYRAVAGQLADCSVKFFDTTEFVAVNDGDNGLPPEIVVGSPETAKRVAFENAHKILDCAIASA
jgi:hypothetical protein